MFGKKTFLAIVVSFALLALPATIAAEEEEPFGIGETMVASGWGSSGHFDYGDGKVVGSYLKFEYNEETGIVGNYIITMSTYDMVYPIMVNEEYWYTDETGEVIKEREFPEYNLTIENVTVFESIGIEGFVPVGHPGAFVDMFISQGEEAIMMFYDRSWNQGYYAAGDANCSVIFKVVDGFEISNYPNYWYADGSTGGERKGEPEGEGGEIPDGWDDKMNYEPLWTEIWIQSEDVVTSIIVNNGNATIENNTISVNLRENGFLEINTQAQMQVFPLFNEIWYSDPVFEKDMMVVETAREDGLIAGEGWYFEADGKEAGVQNSDSNFYDDPTFGMEFMEKGDNSIDVVVDSQIQDGRIVMITLDQKTINADSMDDLLVKFDGDRIESTDSMEELVDLVGSTEARYYALFSDDGITVFVYVPHFSIHTITIEGMLGSILGLSGILVPGAAAVAVVTCAALALMLRGKKGKEEL